MDQGWTGLTLAIERAGGPFPLSGPGRSALTNGMAGAAYARLAYIPYIQALHHQRGGYLWGANNDGRPSRLA